MTEDTIEISEDDIGWYCWCLVEQLDRWIPPNETAKECMDAVEGTYEKHEDMDYDEGFAWEKGYHVGSMAMTEGDIERFRNVCGIDVLNQAEEWRKKKVEEEGQNLPEFELPENWLKGHGAGYVFGEEEVERYLENGGSVGPNWE